MTVTDTAPVDAICDALVANRAKLPAVMRQITDPSPHAVGTRTIGETAQHVSGSAEYFLAVARGEADSNGSTRSMPAMPALWRTIPSGIRVSSPAVSTGAGRPWRPMPGA